MVTFLLVAVVKIHLSVYICMNSEIINAKCVCELQIHYVNMIRASRNDNGYHLYEYFRAYFGSTTYSPISVDIKLKAMKRSVACNARKAPLFQTSDT